MRWIVTACNSLAKDIFKRLHEDDAYYFAANLKIRKKSGEIVPFYLNEAQKIVMAAAEKQLAETGMVRILIPKFRQGGISTFVEGRFNEVNNARKLAEEEKDRVAKENEELRLQLARLQGAAEATANQNSKQESKPEPASIDSLYEQYNEALLIGDSEEVNKLQKEITQQLVKEASDQAKEAAKQEAKKIIEDRSLAIYHHDK